MNERMTYEQTVELERNVKIKDKAKEIVDGFKKRVTLHLNKRNGLRFTLWSDSHNATYLDISEDHMRFVCDFLHEKYSIRVDESSVFDGISNGDRVVNHLASEAGVEYSEYAYRINL